MIPRDRYVATTSMALNVAQGATEAHRTACGHRADQVQVDCFVVPTQPKIGQGFDFLRRLSVNRAVRFGEEPTDPTYLAPYLGRAPSSGTKQTLGELA